MTSPTGKAESTCPQNQPSLAQTQLPVHTSYRTGTCHYFDPRPGSCRPPGSAPRTRDLYPSCRRSPPPSPPRSPRPLGAPARNPAHLPSDAVLGPFQQNLHTPTCPEPPTTKCTKAPCGQRRGTRASRKTQVTEQTQNCPHASRSIPAARWGFPLLESGGVPRGSPVPFTGRPETRGPGPRRPFHSRGPGHRGTRTH